MIERKQPPIVNIKGCKRCRFGKDTQPNTQIVLGIGNPKSKIMIIGDAPGNTEAHLGIPFCGESGNALTELLQHAGLSRDDVYITDACKCWPLEYKKNERTGGTFLAPCTPTKFEIKSCFTFLKEEIDIVKPKVIIAFGNTALSALESCKVSYMKDRKGHPSIYQGSVERIYIMPTYHPSFVLKNGGVWSTAMNALTGVASEVVENIKDAIRLSNDEIAFQKHNYWNIDSRASFEDLINRVRSRGVMTFDIETENLEFETRLLGVGVGLNVGVAAYIPFLVQPDGLGEYLEDYWADKDITKEEAWELLKGLLEDPTIQKAGHNSKFDMGRLHYNNDIDVKGLFWDSMCGGYLIDENGSHQLDDMKNVYIDLIGYKDKMDEETNNKKQMYKASFNTISEYCCGDCDATYRLVKDQLKLFREAQPNNRWYMDNFYVPIMEFLADFEFNGVLYDTDRAKSLRGVYEKKVAQIKDDVIKLVGVPFNPGAPEDVKRVLFGLLGLEHEKKTATGMQATDSDVLEDLAKESPAARMILDYRHVDKMRSTYMESFINQVDKNNRLHISVNPIGTVTGRPSSEGLMNVPRDVDIKSLFIPKPGYSLVQADLSQAEVRCFAHYANEIVLREAYEAGNRDIHCMIGAQMINEPYEHFFKNYKEHVKKYEDIRQAAKSLVFGLLYGRGAASIAKQLGVTTKEAATFMEKFFITFPHCDEWIKATHKLAEKTQEVCNIFGRVRHIPAIASSDEEVKARAKRQAVNSIIQSTASDITCLSLIKVHRRLKEEKLPANIVLTVYDSIIVETFDEYIPYVKTMLKETMEQKPHPDFTIRIIADVDTYGSRGWGIKSANK